MFFMSSFTKTLAIKSLLKNSTVYVYLLATSLFLNVSRLPKDLLNLLVYEFYNGKNERKELFGGEIYSTTRILLPRLSSF